MALGPLSYEGLKYVLQYMETNKRILISQCCPLAQTAERAIPLMIDSLEFALGQIKLNDTTYSIGIYKQYHVGEALDVFETHNDQGGVKFEVDKFGIEDETVKLTPGDVEVAREFRQVDDRNENIVTELEEFIHFFQQMVSSPTAGVFNRNQAENMLRERLLIFIPLQYQRDNAPVPFENQVQLNVTYEGATHIERYMHNKTYHEAVKQLGENLFGKRRHPVLVKNFRVLGKNYIIRLPDGLQFQIRNIRFGGSVAQMCDSLNPIIHESSYPLEHLRADCFEIVHPIVDRTKMITLSTVVHRNFLPTILNSAHPRVYVKLVHLQMQVGFLPRLVRNWIDRIRPIETHYSFKLYHEQPFENWMNEVQREFDGAVLGEKSLIVPMNAKAQMIVSHKESFDVESNRQCWIVEMLVKAVDQ